MDVKDVTSELQTRRTSEPSRRREATDKGYHSSDQSDPAKTGSFGLGLIAVTTKVTPGSTNDGRVVAEK